MQYTLNVCLSVAIVAMVKPAQSTQHLTIDVNMRQNNTVAEVEKLTIACTSKNASESFMYICHNQARHFCLFFLGRME